ncbi:MAG: hypothetical protein HFJ28_05855 [Clostridia bacterium]|nr:hypothetical protein [Clostridia bacterium]
MLNIIWPAFIIISVIYALGTGNIENVSNGIFDSAKSAVELTITFFGTICLWNGIMEIAKQTTLIQKLTKGLKPFIHFLFPEMKQNKQAEEEISMNVVANLLGLGNAATPLGLKAMQTMQKENMKKDTLTNSMAMFIVINTASLQLIPTNVIAIRSSLESNSPSSIILQVWVATIVAAIVGITATKILMKRF